MTRRLSPATSFGSALISSTRTLYAPHSTCARGLSDFYCWFVVGLTSSEIGAYTARVGGGGRSGSWGASAVRFGCLQSMPSSNIDNCAALIHTVPLWACGQTNFPARNLFANSHRPSWLSHRI